MKNDVITLTISKDLIRKMDKVRGPEARASYIRRAIVAFLSKEQPVEAAAPETEQNEQE